MHWYDPTGSASCTSSGSGESFTFTCEGVSVCWVWHHSLRHNYIIRHPPPPSPAPPGPSQLPEQVSRPKCCADLNSPRETPLKAAGTQTHSETGSQRPRLPPSQMCLRMKNFWGQETPKHLPEEPINQRREAFSLIAVKQERHKNPHLCVSRPFQLHLTKYNPLIQVPKEKQRVTFIPSHLFRCPHRRCPLWVEAIISIITLLLFQFIAELSSHQICLVLWPQTTF